MSEPTALLLYQVFTGVRVLFILLAILLAFFGVAMDDEANRSDEEYVRFLLMAVRHLMLAAVCVALASMIPGKAWFLSLIGGAQ